MNMSGAEQDGYTWAMNELRNGTSESEVDRLSNDGHPFDRGAQWALADWKSQKQGIVDEHSH